VAAVDEQELLAVAREAAYAAAEPLRRHFGHSVEGIHSKSTPTDLASEADFEAEAVIRALLGERRPGDAILGEEEGETGQGDLRWVIDPLDGTINFLFGIPAFAVSVACEDALGGLAGVILDPVREECFEATRHGPATLNGTTIFGSERSELATAMVATGFGYDSEVRARQAEVVARVLPRARDIRRFGAAALDLAWCACGRWDAYYERGVKPWDIAAGRLICRRAGLEVRELAADADAEVGLVVAPAGLMGELYPLVDSNHV
jgi:myo-inositol-1(or 4)-monophosphatase